MISGDDWKAEKDRLEEMPLAVLVAAAEARESQVREFKEQLADKETLLRLANDVATMRMYKEIGGRVLVVGRHVHFQENGRVVKKEIAQELK